MIDTAGLKTVTGSRLRLRLVREGDADYIHALRTDPRYNTHLSTVDGSVDDQRRWIVSYKKREAEGTELYYVIERTDGTPCGVVRLYDFEKEQFTWGSWILDHNKPSKAALESAVLIYQISFELIGMSRAVFEVRKENEHTISFHKRFGAQQVGEDAENVYFDYSHTKYVEDIGRYRHILGL